MLHLTDLLEEAEVLQRQEQNLMLINQDLVVLGQLHQFQVHQHLMLVVEVEELVILVAVEVQDQEEQVVVVTVLLDLVLLQGLRELLILGVVVVEVTDQEAVALAALES